MSGPTKELAEYNRLRKFAEPIERITDLHAIAYGPLYITFANQDDEYDVPVAFLRVLVKFLEAQ